MANVYLDVPFSENVNITSPHPNQILIDLNSGVNLAVNVRHYGNTLVQPCCFYRIHNDVAIRAYNAPSKINYYYLTLDNVYIDNPLELTPNELNRKCSTRLKDEIPVLKSVSVKCIVVSWSSDVGGYYGTVKIYVSREDVRNEVLSIGEFLINGRVSSVVKEGDRINAFRCFRCQEYEGHDARNCPSPREYCLKCTGDHRFKYCQIKDANAFRCINCMRGGRENVRHMAGTFYCPIEMERRADRDRVKEKMAAKRRANNDTTKNDTTMRLAEGNDDETEG